MIELLAAIPSVVIGLWGVFILAPFLRDTVEAWIVSVFGWIPFLGGPAYGIGLFTAATILAIMILPTIVTISREVIQAVPGSQREAMFALGATRWETIRRVAVAVRPVRDHRRGHPRPRRALGETLAVTMVIGNRDAIPSSLFDQTQTIASKRPPSCPASAPARILSVRSLVAPVPSSARRSGPILPPAFLGKRPLRSRR